ncbi:16S rRNA (adenine(1518)-N(6)/adenine(1519)-N(6))-dimethyltransferase RsmA [Prochlorococcus sp. MIT 1307]|uniref:16S rRNA (adenine(1518)-N(6)/adenine(1519)-N(6))- dimethyltransferase RsmA n=1 Tax=Prochlorococcus sp. MIT 1307 TaxID=3096219 RepID=UPI002A766560|nr:16S rRNA (adenine(1518)-N(6)/adenine(1519)-N(6))-dimethyltransferase RsmA [Prochlorococcus sp. MIT 1307]
MPFSGHIARKRLGQHWLKDVSVLESIVEAADLQCGDRVLEVGPGRGVLTERLLASQVAAVHAVELDADLVVGLKERFASQPRFTLQQGDVLSIPLTPPCGILSNKVVANIPYNITGPLLERLVGRLGKPIERTYKLLVLLLQKEVAERILARQGQSNFSALSVRLQLLAKCRSICQVPPSCFQPRPKVHSQVISIEPVDEEHRLDSALALRVDELLRKAFTSRRKMLRNSLRELGSLNELEGCAKNAGISLDQRPQEVSPQEWLVMAKNFNFSNEVSKQL